MVNGCEYCTRAHGAAAKRAGVTDEEVRARAFGAATVSEATLETLRRHLSVEQAVELALVVAMANFTNRINDGLRIAPALGEPGVD